VSILPLLLPLFFRNFYTSCTSCTFCTSCTSCTSCTQNTHNFCAIFPYEKTKAELCPRRTKLLRKQKGGKTFAYAKAKRTASCTKNFVLVGQSSSFCSCAIFPYEKTKEARGTKGKAKKLRKSCAYSSYKRYKGDVNNC